MEWVNISIYFDSQPQKTIIMKKYQLIIYTFTITLILATFSLSAQQQASGYVYFDRNNNQVRDAGEKGISDVAVSNGTEVVKTNQKGRYELAVSDDTPIFVIKPKKWMPPVDENNLPQFYYLHKPEGSPDDFKYPGVEPTGALPEEINFPLYPHNSSPQFRIAVFGDPQPYNIKEVDYFAQDIVRELIGGKSLEFGITTGDIVGDDLELFTPVNQAVSQIGIPWYNILGNHDINFKAPSDELSDETFERIYGPATYAFVYGDVHFIVVDDVIHESKAGSHKYIGGLRADQFSFVENYLETIPKEALVVLNMHIPLMPEKRYYRQDDLQKLLSLLSEFPNTLSISSHTHVQQNYFFGKDTSGWQRERPHHHFNTGTTSGSWWQGLKSETGIPHTMMRDGTPNGYAFINFDGNDYTIDWKVGGSDAGHRMNIHVPQGITAGSDENAVLTVNFFNGSEQTEVQYRVKGLTDWKTMEKTLRVDPFYAELKQRWENFEGLNMIEQWENNDTINQPFPGRSLPEARPCTHLWEAGLGTDWPAGRHTIEVKVKDRYGRTFTDYQTLRVKK